MNNLSSYCGLVDAKIRASDKDLPVLTIIKALELWFVIRAINLPIKEGNKRLRKNLKIVLG